MSLKLVILAAAGVAAVGALVSRGFARRQRRPELPATTELSTLAFPPVTRSTNPRR